MEKEKVKDAVIQSIIKNFPENVKVKALKGKKLLNESCHCGSDKLEINITFIHSVKHCYVVCLKCGYESPKIDQPEKIGVIWDRLVKHLNGIKNDV